jgi:hypothetical protein
VVKVVEEVKALAEGRVEPEPCSVASSVLLCIVLISLSGSFIGAQTNFSSGLAFVISTSFPLSLHSATRLIPVWRNFRGSVLKKKAKL